MIKYRAELLSRATPQASRLPKRRVMAGANGASTMEVSDPITWA